MILFTCPICQKRSNEYPALSRKDNKTNICNQCGMNEAFVDYYGYEGLKK